eukprot:153915_1
MPARSNPCNKLADSPLFEMQKSSYLFTEATSLLLLIASCIISWQYTIYGSVITIIIFVILFHGIWFIAALIARPKLTTPPHSSWFKIRHKVPVLKEKQIQTKDGCHLKYYISQTINKSTQKKKIICLAPPLGQCGMYHIYLLQHSVQSQQYKNSILNISINPTCIQLILFCADSTT